CVVNQRFTTVALSTRAVLPVPTPTTTPQRRYRFAPSLTLGRAENLAEPWCLSTPSSRPSPAQRRALSGTTRARVPPLPPSPHGEPLSDVGYGAPWERPREIWIKSGGSYSVSPSVQTAPKNPRTISRSLYKVEDYVHRHEKASKKLTSLQVMSP